jgi:uncharacterized protein YehS (DUF1456 family)
MTNNDILRRLRYVFDFSNAKMVAIFAQADKAVTKEEIISWFEKEGELGYQKCNDRTLATFLNGFINERRGKREGDQPVSEKKLTNNMILMKLKIALNLKTDDILEILELVDFKVSQHELSAFFRKPGNKHYRECKDQILRNFLMGVQIKFRGKPESKGDKVQFDWG